LDEEEEEQEQEEAKPAVIKAQIDATAALYLRLLKAQAGIEEKMSVVRESPEQFRHRRESVLRMRSRREQAKVAPHCYILEEETQAAASKSQQQDAAVADFWQQEAEAAVTTALDTAIPTLSLDAVVAGFLDAQIEAAAYTASLAAPALEAGVVDYLDMAIKDAADLF